MHILGIDLGTTKSSASVYVDGHPKIIANREGSLITPSVIGFTTDGKILIGDAAIRQATLNPLNTVYSAKRYIGRSYKNICGIARKMPFLLEAGPYQEVRILVEKKTITPTQIIYEILKYLKICAEEYLQQEVKMAVVGVPVDSNEFFRQAVRDAGKMADLNIIRVIDETSCVIFGMNEHLRDKSTKIIAIINYGGGSFEISIIEVGSYTAEVKSTRGDSQLGGDIIDLLIVEWMIQEFKNKNNIDLYQDPTAFHRLKDAAVKAKLELSSALKSDICVPYIFINKSIYKDFSLQITRSKLVELIKNLLFKIKILCEIALKDAGISVDNVDDVVLIGGSTRIPEFKKLIEFIFNKKPYGKNNPDEGVVEGLAVLGGILSGDVKDILLLDVTPYALGLETDGESQTTEIIKKGETIPVRRSKIFTTTYDNQKKIHINVIQSDSNDINKNVCIARLDFEDIPEMPCGKPKIKLTYDVDANGIIHVIINNIDTGKEKRIEVVASQENFKKQNIIVSGESIPTLRK